MKIIKMVRWFLSFGIILITILLLAQINGMQTRYTTVSVRLNSDITKKMLCDDLQKEEEAQLCKIKDITAFSQKEAIIESKDMERKSKLMTYCIYGKVEDVLPVSLVSGNLLIRDDGSGCVLTKQTAFQLFGNIDVIGVQVKINQRTYTIRGIIEANSEAVFYEAELDTDTFECLEFTIEDENGEFYANQFVQIYGLSADYIIGGNYLVKTIKNLCILPFLIVILDLTVGLVRKEKQYSKKRGMCYLTVIVGIIAVFLVCKLLGYFPERWIPSKWSNFKHYSEISANIKSQLHLLSFAKPIAKEITLKSDLMKVLCLFTASIVGQLYLIRCINDWGSRIVDKTFQHTNVIRRNIITWRQNIIAKKQKVEENEKFNS